MKKEKTKRITKKAVIKKLLMDELNSDEMQGRILAYGEEHKIRWDMMPDDDSRIKFIDDLRKAEPKKKIQDYYKGRRTLMLLTPRAYLLLVAYKRSASEIMKMRDAYQSRAFNALTIPSWNYEMAMQCWLVDNEIREELYK